jgi:hypothetical protein
VVSGWPRPSSAPSPAGPENCRMWPHNPRMWPHNPPFRSNQSLHARQQ